MVSLRTSLYNNTQFHVLPTQRILPYRGTNRDNTLSCTNWQIFTTRTKSVYCAIRTEYLNIIHFNCRVLRGDNDTNHLSPCRACVRPSVPSNVFHCAPTPGETARKLGSRVRMPQTAVTFISVYRVLPWGHLLLNTSCPSPPLKQFKGEAAQKPIIIFRFFRRRKHTCG
jgi:hypothetical protein